jgi:hypothetical protein
VIHKTNRDISKNTATFIKDLSPVGKRKKKKRKKSENCRIWGLANTNYNTLIHIFLGMSGFQTPEIITGNEFSEKWEVWSLGMCLWDDGGQEKFSKINMLKLFEWLDHIVSKQY